MSYQIAHSSSHVLIPVTFVYGEESRRFNGPIHPTDAPSVMVLYLADGHPLRQDMHPLRVSAETERYPGKEWELRTRNLEGNLQTFYLGIPDSCFEHAAGGPPAWDTVSMQVVGTPLLNPGRAYSGGVDILLQPQVEFPLLPGFLNLAERFFPTLLPWNFMEGYVLETFRPSPEKEQLLLRVDLQMDAFDKMPISLEKLWDPQNWLDAVVENLVPGHAGVFTVQGGCFFTRARKTTHWFGGRIGLEERSFRSKAAKAISALGPSEHGAWVFWLACRDSAGRVGKPPLGPSRKGNSHFSLRHSMLFRLWAHRKLRPEPILPGRPGPMLGKVPLPEAVNALGEVADLLVRHQTLLQLVRRASRSGWSAVDGGSLLSRGEAGEKARELEQSVAALQRDKGDVLKELESVFDQSCGFFSWDVIGNPVLDNLANYLAAQTGDRILASP